MVGLALEGGGSRGSYHIGVMKAFIEAEYNFSGFVGTSIGAINAAAFAQGDFKKAADMWTGITTEQLFDAEFCKLLKIGESKWDLHNFTDASQSLRKIIDEHGVDTSRIRELIDDTISEEKMRSSGHDYGLVTVCINEMKPYELYIEDIEQGELLSYISASACVPGFHPVVIGKNTFADGALYNNCPINMLINKGYKEIVAVRTKAPGVYRAVRAPKGVKIRKIVPKHDLGNVMIFDPKRIRENIAYGYRDGLEALREIREPKEKLYPLSSLSSLPSLSSRRKTAKEHNSPETDQ